MRCPKIPLCWTDCKISRFCSQSRETLDSAPNDFLAYSVVDRLTGLFQGSIIPVNKVYFPSRSYREMRLSKRGEYGLRAMIALAEPAEKSASPRMMQIKEISLREGISAKFLEQILLALKNNGLLHSKMGVGGGYYLAKPAQEITLGQVFRVLDGPIAPVKCVSQMAYEPCGCPAEETCGLRLVMGDVRNAIADILDRTSLTDVVKRRGALKKKIGVKGS